MSVLQQLVREATIVGQQQKALAVTVQPANVVHSCRQRKVCEGGPRRASVLARSVALPAAQDHVRLEEGEVALR